MLSISHMKLFKRTKKLELNLHIEFGRAVLSTIFVSRRKLWNHLSNPCSKKAGQISSHPVSLSNPGWKNLHTKAGQKLSRPAFYPVRFSYKQPIKIRNIKIRCCDWIGLLSFLRKPIRHTIICLIVRRKLFFQNFPLFFSN